MSLCDLVDCLLGADIYTCNKYFVAVQRTVYPHDVTTFTAALSVVMASYEVFDIIYNKSLVGTLEYIER